MILWIYWDNSQGWHTRKICEVEAENIVLADEFFEEIMGMHPSKVSNYSVQQFSLEGVE